MNKGIILLGIALLLVGCGKTDITSFEDCIAAGYPAMESYPQQCSDGTSTFTETIDEQVGEEQAAIIGGQRDEHGCLGPAGYSWNEDVGACVREWELDDVQRAEATIAVGYLNEAGLTVVDAYPEVCQGCFVVILQNRDSDIIKVNLVDGTVVGELPSGQTMAYSEAVEIAQNSECMEEGTLVDEYIYNNNTKTWWINLDIEKEGCSPACVVSEETRTAEINWRCTGLIEE